MAKYHRFTFLFVCFALSIWFTPDALADSEMDTLSWQHALAMHGAPKYGSDFDHIEYANPNAPKGGTLKEGIVGSFDTLNHHIIMGEMARGLSLTSDRLMHRVWDEPFSLYGLVADKIKINADRSKILFHLNPNARFHDGTPMTAQDVKFSYEAYRKNGHPVRRRVYGLIQKVTIISDSEILFEFGDGYDQESALILAIMPVIPKHYWQNHDITKTTLTPPLGSGPYKIKTVDPGREIVYQRVADYWGADLAVNKGMYNFDEIKYSYYRDTGIALEAFKAGETNLRREYDISAWKTAYKSPRLENGAFVQKQYEHHRPEKVRAFIFNTRKERFSDPRVRKALSLAFNFDHLNQLFFDGAFQRTESYFANSELAHQNNKNIEPFSYPASLTPVEQRANLRKAKELLNQAGYKVVDKALIHETTGEPFTFEILLNASNDEKVALYYKETLQRLGIDVSIRTVDTAQFTGRLDQFDYDVVLYQWINSLSPGAEQLNYWGSNAADRNGSRNYAGVKSKAIDNLALSISSASDRAGLVDQTQKMDHMLMNGYYSLPLWYLGADMIAHNANLQNNGYVPMYGTVIETWWTGKE